jgi:hypothetical protein
MRKKIDIITINKLEKLFLLPNLYIIVVKWVNKLLRGAVKIKSLS